jgi:hypothetical protein
MAAFYPVRMTVFAETIIFGLEAVRRITIRPS